MFDAVVQSAADRPTPVPWNDRFFDAFPVAPVWVGAAVAIALLGVLLGIASAAGRLAAT